MQKATGVVGLGYVGLPLAVGLARAGNKVYAFDANKNLVDRLTEGKSHIQDVSDQDLKDVLELGIEFVSSAAKMAEAGQYVICVPTPLASDGYPDLGYVEQAARNLAPLLVEGDLVILESTTYPGTTEELILPILESVSGLVVGVNLHLAFSPERIDPGNSSFGVTNTPKVVGGFHQCCLRLASSLYESLGIPVVHAKGLKEAELSKLLENTYRHINIALVNEMVKFCRALDIDLNDAIRCAATKPFGFQAFYPGPGVGGHCIPIDPNYLSYRVRTELGYSFKFVELAQEINASMPAYVVGRVVDELNEIGKALRGARILIAGVTYKQDVADTRESPAVPLAEILIDKGAHVEFLDPFVDQWQVLGSAIPKVELKQAEQMPFDCVVVLQHHQAFAGIDFASRSRVILDTRGQMQGENVKSL